MTWSVGVAWGLVTTAPLPHAALCWAAVCPARNLQLPSAPSVQSRRNSAGVLGGLSPGAVSG